MMLEGRWIEDASHVRPVLDMPCKQQEAQTNEYDFGV
jgi:hypothetical protein